MLSAVLRDIYKLDIMLIRTLCSKNSTAGNALEACMAKLPRITANSTTPTSEFWLVHFSDNNAIQQFISGDGGNFNWTDTFCVDESKLFNITGTMNPSGYVCVYGIVVVENEHLLFSGQSTLLSVKKTKIGCEYSLKTSVNAGSFCKVSVASTNGALV